MADDADICNIFRMYPATDTSGRHRYYSHGYFFLDICCDISFVSALDSPCRHQVLSDAAQAEIEPAANLQHISLEKISLICHM